MVSSHQSIYLSVSVGLSNMEHGIEHLHPVDCGLNLSCYSRPHLVSPLHLSHQHPAKVWVRVHTAHAGIACPLLSMLIVAKLSKAAKKMALLSQLRWCPYLTVLSHLWLRPLGSSPATSTAVDSGGAKPTETMSSSSTSPTEGGPPTRAESKEAGTGRSTGHVVSCKGIDFYLLLSCSCHHRWREFTLFRMEREGGLLLHCISRYIKTCYGSVLTLELNVFV